MKSFYLLLVNNTVAYITSFTVWFALIFFLYLETQSVLVTSVISGIYLVVVAGTGFWLGSLVDRYNKKKVLIASGLFSLVVYIIGFIIYLAAPTSTFKDTTNPLLWIFIVIILIGVIAGNIRGIVMPAVIPAMVDKDNIDKANGMAGTAMGVSILIVSVISGLLVGHSGMLGVFILSIVLYIISIIHLWFLDIPNVKSDENKDDEPQKIDVKGTIKILKGIPGLLPLILFTTFNNFLGGVFMSLMDAYGLSLVSVEVWGILFGFISLSFIVGGVIISKKGVGKNPLRTLFLTNIVIWAISSVFTIQPSIVLISVGMFIYMAIVPFIEASEHTIIQKLVPQDRLGRVFGFAQSVEQAASPLTAFIIGPLTQIVFIPFMSEGGKGAELIGSWFGTGPNRGIALVFTVVGIIGLIITILAMRSKSYKNLSTAYLSRT